MGRVGLFDLEKHFAFYGAYHSNPINIAIHVLFVWPILFTSLLLLYFTPPLFKTPELGLEYGLVFNYGFLFAAIYALFYVFLDYKAGSLAALLCLFCWAGSSLLAQRLGFSLAWKRVMGDVSKSARWDWFLHSYFLTGLSLSNSQRFQVVLAAQLFCWTGQFIGHGVFEKRAPALLDNLTQAFLMAPFFVLLEVFQSLFGYEPYPGFHTRVKAKIRADIKEWQDKKGKKLS